MGFVFALLRDEDWQWTIEKTKKEELASYIQSKEKVEETTEHFTELYTSFYIPKCYKIKPSSGFPAISQFHFSEIIMLYVDSTIHMIILSQGFFFQGIHVVWSLSRDVPESCVVCYISYYACTTCYNYQCNLDQTLENRPEV